ncbi:butyrophilin-like protein 9 [Simochromis diagramma]|uniref:butyrophilin-like protein 9 n=1 Tax=Simochromis diagramma TaxID=43689 RepID=UPI001A7E2AA6|nr:butyrophilin-like protein 9 [Simochromis diagramma]
MVLYRDEQFVPDDQHPSFKNRVDLQDRQMKDGDVSLILYNVTINDNGTYECRVVMKETRSWKSISIITLSVVDPPGQPGGHTEDGGKKDGGKEAGRKEAGGKKDGSVGLIAGLSVSAVFVTIAVGCFLICNKNKQQQSQDSFQPAVGL